jgi:uncharacterized membrane protein YphA (DoxX/SURF4 family)
MAQAFLVGRILVGCYYLFNAYHHFVDATPMARLAAMNGVPAPKLAVVLAGVLLLVAGLTLLLGIFPEYGIAAVVLFLIPVTLIMHAFWTEVDPGIARMQQVNFTKNIALLGTSIMLLAVPRPWPLSLEGRWRLPIRATV